MKLSHDPFVFNDLIFTKFDFHKGRKKPKKVAWVWKFDHIK